MGVYILCGGMYFMGVMTSGVDSVGNAMANEVLQPGFYRAWLLKNANSAENALNSR